MTILMDEEKKKTGLNSTLLHDKNSQQARNGNFPNLIKNIYKNPMAAKSYLTVTHGVLWGSRGLEQAGFRHTQVPADAGLPKHTCVCEHPHIHSFINFKHFLSRKTQKPEFSLTSLLTEVFKPDETKANGPLDGDPADCELFLWVGRV